MMAGVEIATPGYPAFNIYDVRKPCEEFGTCYPDDHLWQAMNDYEFRSFWDLPHDKAKEWKMCNSAPHIALMGDFNEMWGWALAPLLDQELPVLIYNGDQDYICNYMGAIEWTNALVWEGQEGYQRA